jgi:hypothetical protein
MSAGKYKRLALIAETASDARNVIVGEGPAPGEGSGIRQVHPKDFRPVYEPSKRKSIPAPIRPRFGFCRNRGRPKSATSTSRRRAPIVRVERSRANHIGSLRPGQQQDQSWLPRFVSLSGGASGAASSAFSIDCSAASTSARASGCLRRRETAPRTVARNRYRASAGRTLQAIRESGHVAPFAGRLFRCFSLQRTIPLTIRRYAKWRWPSSRF